jgi:hypothetical protein
METQVFFKQAIALKKPNPMLCSHYGGMGWKDGQKLHPDSG